MLNIWKIIHKLMGPQINLQHLKLSKTTQINGTTKYRQGATPRKMDFFSKGCYDTTQEGPHKIRDFLSNGLIQIRDLNLTITKISQYKNNHDTHNNGDIFGNPTVTIHKHY